MVDFPINVVIDPSNARRGARQVRNELGRVESQADSLRRSIQNAFAFIGVAAGLTALTRSVTEFQTAIAEIATIADPATTSIERLRDVALEQAAAFGQQPVQQARAIYQIISAGAGSSAEAVEILTAANRLATGGLTDVRTAADGLSSVLGAYGDAVRSAADVSDILFVGVRAGRTTVEELSRTLGRVTPLAASAGVGFDQLTAAVAALTTGGISTAEAVTGVRAILASILRPTSEAAGVAEDLGIEFSAAALEAQGLQQFLENLIVATGGSTDLLSQLFTGVEALVPILALTGEAGQTFSDVLVDMENRAGVTDEAVAQIANTFQFQLNRALQIINTELISTGDTITQALVPALVFLNDNSEIVIATVTALAFVLGVTLAQVAIGAAIRGINLLTAAIAANPFGALAVAVVATTGFLVSFSDQLTISESSLVTLADVGQATWETIRAGIETVVNFFTSNFPIILSVAQSVFGDVEISIEGILRVAARVIDTVVGVFTGGVRAILAAFNVIPGAIERIFVNEFNAIARQFTTLINFIISGLNSLAGVSIAPLEAFQVTATSDAVNVGRAITDAFGQGIRESTAATDALDQILARSEEIAQSRVALIEQTEDVGAAASDALVETNNVLNEIATGRSGAGGQTATFRELADALRQENELLRLNRTEREILQGVLEFENQLKRSLTETERQLVEQLIRENQSLQVQSQLLEEIRGPQERLAERQQALQALYQDGRISVQEYTEALRELNVETTALDNTFGGGLANGIARVAAQANELGSQVSDFVVGAFDQATDAIVNFARTGELNVREFFASLAEQLLRLTTNQLFAQLLGGLGLGGAGGGAAGGLLSGLGGLFGFQNGGSFMVPGAGPADSQLVAFRATPGERVDVSTPGQQMQRDQMVAQQQQQQPLNLRIVNQIDPRETLSALTTPAGERTILNVIERNPAAVSRILSR